MSYEGALEGIARHQKASKVDKCHYEVLQKASEVIERSSAVIKGYQQSFYGIQCHRKGSKGWKYEARTDKKAST
jgi:hypothetical protein